MSSAKSREKSSWPVWWFVLLDLAITRGDYRAAADAQSQLERLGVEVRYAVRRPAQEVSRAV